jgi:hypothetical protein
MEKKMKHSILFALVAGAMLCSNTVLAVKFYLWGPVYWKVEKADGCGASPLVWDTTTTEFHEYEEGNINGWPVAKYDHDYTLPDYDIDGIRIMYVTPACPYTSCGAGKCFDNWRYRRKVNGVWTWDTNCEYEGFHHSEDDPYNDEKRCYYRIEQLGNICNRDYVNTGVRTQVAYTKMQGQMANGNYKWDSLYFSTPAH